jgi:RND family efflux transporter MFP subunit
MKKLILLMIFTLTLSVFASEKNQPSYRALVVTAKVEKGIINFVQTFSGTLYYNTKSKIATEVEGVVETFSFQEGQIVNKGDILTSLDSKVLQANIMAKIAMIKAMKADLTRQERELERSKVLFKRNSISQSNYDMVFYATEQQRAQVEAMQSELNAMNLQMQKTHIQAPFNSVVVERGVEVGQWLAKGSTVATLVVPQSIEAKVNVPFDFIQNIRAYKKFSAKIGTDEIEISLKSVIPLADNATRTFPLRFHVPKEMGLIEGMRIDIDIPTLKKEDALLVPRDAVIKRFEKDVVFAVVDAKAVMIPVKIIGYKIDRAAVSAEGLSEEMRVVVKGNERITPNMPIVEKVHQ